MRYKYKNWKLKEKSRGVWKNFGHIEKTQKKETHIEFGLRSKKITRKYKHL